MNYSFSLILRGYEVLASIGIHAEERAAKQRLIIDVEVTLNSSGPADDHIQGTLDYDFLRGEILEIVSSGHYDLQETICRAIADKCMARESVESVMVYSRKPDIYPDCESVGIRLITSPKRTP